MNVGDKKRIRDELGALPNGELKLSGEHLQGLYIKFLSTIAQREKRHI